MNFKPFSKAIRKKFDTMSKDRLFQVDVSKDELWNTYLDAYPEGTNEIYKERREYDCNCCKNFIRKIGIVVNIENGVLDSVWNVEGLSYPYDVVATKLHEYVTTKHIKTIFLNDEKKVGAETNRQMVDGEIINWDHFYAEVPRKFVIPNVNTIQSKVASTFAVFKRGLEELKPFAMEDVIDLIKSKSIYRGEEFLASIVSFRGLQKKYKKLNSETAKDLFVWENINNKYARFRNTVIGTLLVDISNDENIEDAVRKFESKVAPQNYKRTSSLISPLMIKNAMQKIDDLGIENSLKRRFATIDDVSVNDVLFADRSTIPKMKDSLIDSLMTEVKENPKKYDNIIEVDVDHFLENVLPKATSLEVMMENSHINNLMSIVAPIDEESPKIMKWDNNFSWSYNNNLTDSSIKTKVAAAGGNVNAVLRASLSWYNTDDLDIHVKEPSGVTIYHGRKDGKLDVDMNVSSGNASREAVENVSWKTPQEGTYVVSVDNYTKRENIDIGFVVELEANGELKTYSRTTPATGKKPVVTFDYEDGIIKNCKPAKGITEGGETISKEEWGVTTNKFNKVEMVMLSPNYWNGQKLGNKHIFFLLEGCKNPDETRGIYNEYLIDSLHENRKVFDIIADKTKCKKSDEQLSGLGFSSTQRKHVVMRVNGQQPMKIKF